MKPTFHHRLVNGRYEDPCLYVRTIREGRAFLFDAGVLGGLVPADIQKITDVFVTHQHIDHFIGFDTILRALLRREQPLRIYGPEDIIACVGGKLMGYTWNLIEDYPLIVEVSGISERSVSSAVFSARDRFRRTDRDSRPFEGIVLRDPPYTVEAAELSHGIPCLGFSISEDFHINIDKAALSELGLPVGPWLSILKSMIREDAPVKERIKIEGREFLFGDIRHVATVTEGQKVSYLTDLSPTEENVRQAARLAAGSHTLYCEAYFLHEDLERARRRHHLTARMAGEVARKAGVKTLVPIHFSPKYRDRPGVLEEEAMAAFRGSADNL